MNRSKLSALVAASVFAGLMTLSSIPALHAQKTSDITRNTVATHDLSTIPGQQVVVNRVEMAPGAKEDKHTHPGDLFGYVIEGTLVMNVEGQAPKTVPAGGVFFVAGNAVHWGENTGQAPCKVLATIVFEKGKPITSPAK
jgi:quercetin dioxygenase-like cupin family protein